MKFHLAVETNPTDPHSNILNVKSLQVRGEDVMYVLPADAQPLTLHSMLQKHSVIVSIKNDDKTWPVQKPESNSGSGSGEGVPGRGP